jgi:predicted Zn-dependent peptidase
MIERHVEKTVLNNGLVVVSEAIEHVCSVSLGIWIRAGSRHETAEQNGISHFIEHALFKGTSRRSARQIAIEADILGGNLDAFTTHEFTGYYIKALDTHLEQSFDILADLVTCPAFDSVEIEKERTVILEEIKMVDDTPEEVVHEIFDSSFWPEHPLGRPIEGTAERVQSFSRDALAGFYGQTYHPKNIVIAAAGSISHSRIVEIAERYFGHMRSIQEPAIDSPPGSNIDFILRKKRGLEQTHLVLGTDCPSLHSPDRYSCGMLNTILGGGLSSRLFQSVREDHGLAYSVYSSINAFRDVGCLTIYMAVSGARAQKALDLALREIRILKEEPVSEQELKATKDQIKAALLINLDSISGRMSSLAHDEIIYGRDLSIDELIMAIEQVSSEQIQEIANRIFHKDRLGLVMLSGNSRMKLDRKILAC